MRNGKKLINVGWLTADEQLQITECKKKISNEYFFGEQIGDRVFFMTLVKLQLNDSE